MLLHTEVTGSIFFNNFFSGSKCYRGVLYVSYQLCGAYNTMPFSLKLSGYILNNYYLPVKVTAVFGTYVIRFAVCILSDHLHGNYQGDYFNNFFFG